MKMRSGTDKRLGQEQGRGWIRNWDGDRIRIWDGMGEALGWGWVRIQPQPWHCPGQGMEWHQPYLGVVELGGTGDGVDVCPHQRGDEADWGRIWRLFGLGGETTPPPLQAVSPDHCGWDVQ